MLSILRSSVGGEGWHTLLRLGEAAHGFGHQMLDKLASGHLFPLPERVVVFHVELREQEDDTGCGIPSVVTGTTSAEASSARFFLAFDLAGYSGEAWSATLDPNC
jgi:hypothetical protein